MTRIDRLFSGLQRSREKALVVYLTAGDDDRLEGLLQGSLDLHLALRAAGLPSELRITDGGHGWSVWSAALRESLLFLAGAARAGGS